MNSKQRPYLEQYGGSLILEPMKASTSLGVERSVSRAKLSEREQFSQKGMTSMKDVFPIAICLTPISALRYSYRAAFDTSEVIVEP